MIVTGADPRARWRTLAELPELTDVEAAELAALPVGAREAPLEWLFELRTEERGRFDKDAQGEVVWTERTAKAWRARPDPRVRRAGLISLCGVEHLGLEVLGGFPGVERLGASITALMLEGHHLHGAALGWIGATRPWTELAIWGARWSDAARAAGLAALTTAWPALRGLALLTARPTAAELRLLAASSFLPGLEELTLSSHPLDGPAAAALAGRLPPLVLLDLRGAALAARSVAAFVPAAARARWLELSGNALGDAGLRKLIDAGGLASCEELRLSGCGLSDAAVRALVAADPPRLRALWLDGNGIGDAGIEALARSPLFGRLDDASLAQRGLTPRSSLALEGHPLAAALERSMRREGCQRLWFLGR